MVETECFVINVNGEIHVKDLICHNKIYNYDDIYLKTPQLNKQNN